MRTGGKTLLSFSDLFHCPWCASALLLYCEHPTALVQLNLLHGKKDFLVVGFPLVYKPHSCGPQEKRNCRTITSSTEGWLYVLPPENLNFSFLHAEVSSTFLQQQNTYYFESKTYETKKDPNKCRYACV